MWPAGRRGRGHAVHLRELAAVDPAAGGAAVHRGAAGGGAALRLGAAEAGGEGRGAAGSPAAGTGRGGVGVSASPGPSAGPVFAPLAAPSSPGWRPNEEKRGWGRSAVVLCGFAAVFKHKRSGVGQRRISSSFRFHKSWWLKS